MVRSRVTMPPSRLRSRDPRGRAAANIFLPGIAISLAVLARDLELGKRRESQESPSSLTVSLAWTENERLLRIAQFCRAWNLAQYLGFPGTPSRTTRIANVAGNILESGKKFHRQRHVRDVFRAEICFARNSQRVMVPVEQRARAPSVMLPSRFSATRLSFYVDRWICPSVEKCIVRKKFPIPASR